jgi:membrane associated rhomboid family serine protease
LLKDSFRSSSTASVQPFPLKAPDLPLACASPQVGQRQEVGARQAQLPAFEPLCSYLAAAWAAVATAGMRLFPSLFPAEATVMYRDLAAEGQLYQFVTANFAAATWADLAAGVALLATAGAAAERMLGRARFAAIYLLSGVTGTACYFALSLPGDPGAFQCGTAGGLVGVSAAMAVVCLRNRRLLTPGQLAGMAGAAMAAASGAVAADYFLEGDHTFIGGAYVAAAVAGVALGAACSPRYEILREVLIPDGSVEVPEDAPEMEVVVDRTTGLQQWGACLGFALALGLFTLGITDTPRP